MYAQSVINRRLERAAKKLGFEPEHHSISACRSAVEALNTLVDTEGGLKRPLRPDEIKWVRNERAVSQCDFRYWITRYCYIKDWTDRPVLFTPNIAQEIKLDIWAMLEGSGRSVTEMDEKARQLGVTTLTELAVAHRVQHYPFVNAVVGSADPEKSLKMAGIMEFAWQMQPWWLLPRTTKYNSGELIEFGGQNSGVSIQHGAQFSGISRGSTPTVAHLSELVDFKNPEQLVDASLLRAMHESPFLFLVLESTARGRHNWWHTTWEYSKENWKHGRARFYPVFLPWFIGRDLYPTETWIHSRPIPRDWRPAGLTKQHAERAKQYVEANQYLRKHLGDGWEMPVDQMWFWEVTRAEYAAKNELSQFYSEMPADDNEAFQSLHNSAFNTEVIQIYRERTRNPLQVYGIIGAESEIPLRMQPDRRDVDTDKPPLTVRCRWNPTAPAHEYTFVPLRFDGYSTYDPMGKLIVYEMPEKDEEYGVGVDTADGIGLDRSVLEVLRKGTYARDDAQVCEFASPYINAFDLWPICLAVGTFYSTVRDGNLRQAKMVIECNRNGESTQFELRKRGWGNFHQWMRYDAKRLRQSAAHKIGWFTTEWSREMMMDYLVKMLRDGWIDIFSPWFINEMADLEREMGKQKLRAAHGGHDDRIMALGIVLFSLHIMELRGPRRVMALERAARSNTTVVHPIYHPGPQGSDVNFGEDTPLRRLIAEEVDKTRRSVILPWEQEAE